MALSAEDKRRIRRVICHSALADSIITKIDTPLSSLTNREIRVLKIALPSTSLVTEIAGKLFLPSAVTDPLKRTLQLLATNSSAGARIATEIGS